MNTLWTFGDSFTAGHGCKPFGPIENVGTDNGNHYEKRYKTYIDLNKKIWPEIVSENFGMQLNNLGINGLTNELILDNLLKHVTLFDKTDLVIIQTSTVGRYPFPFLKEKSLLGGVKNTKTKSCQIYEMYKSPYMVKTIFSTNIENEWNDSMVNMLQHSNLQENINNKSLLLNKHKYDTIRNFFAEFISTMKYYEIAIWRATQLSKILTNLGIKNYIINEDIWPEDVPKPNNLIELHPNGIFAYVVETNQTIYSDTSGKITDWHPSYDGHISISNFILNFIQNENINIHNT